MITPLDIQNKDFSRAVRGYKEDEVDEFLDLITVDMEKLINENVTLKQQIAKQEEDLNKYRSSDDAVLATLEAAKKLMGDISESAEKRAEILLKNAELDAKLIQREAKESVERLTEETIILKRRFAEFRTRYKTMLESELERFESTSAEIYSQYGIDDLNELAGTSKYDYSTSDVLKDTSIVARTAKKQTRSFDEAVDMEKTMVNFRPIDVE